MKTISTLAILISALLLTAFPAPAGAAEGKQELKQRFEQRYPAIREAKSAGKLGETSDGTIEAVKDADAATQKLIAEENTDRAALYKLLAADEGTTSDLVAKRAAARNFERAKKGDYLKQGGVWRQK